MDGDGNSIVDDAAWMNHFVYQPSIVHNLGLSELFGSNFAQESWWFIAKFSSFSKKNKGITSYTPWILLESHQFNMAEFMAGFPIQI